MFPDLTRRSLELERLDTGDFTEAEYARWQREMYYINRLLGDTRCLRLALKDRLGKNGSGYISILDVGAGSGDLLASVQTLATGSPFLVGCDLNFDAARSIAARTGVHGVQSDGLKLPFGDESFDIVACSLFLHHLSDGAAVELISEMRRVARIGLVAIDLHRHAVAHFLYRLMGRVVLQKFTLDDGSLSIRRSFRPNELLELANRAGVKNPMVQRRAAFRLVLTGSE